jgi:hypothetical protein
MQRPMMDTIGAGSSLPRTRRGANSASPRSGFRRLFSNPFRKADPQLLFEDEEPIRRRFVRGLVYRLALLPAMLMLAAAALVYVRTHPSTPPLSSADPLSQGVYYEPINLLTEDGIRLDAWLAPALDAEQVLADGESSLHQRWPAVVLVHGFGMTRLQVLPLIEPLHRHGWVVLALGLRGTGSVRAGETFGLNESLDVKAAVELLRRRPYVDGAHIAVVGIGTGANAALLAADGDHALAALVLDAPQASGIEALNQHIVDGEPSLQWMLPLCRLAFTLGYGVDVDDLNLPEYGRVLAARPTLLMHWPQDAQGDLPAARIGQITDFLDTAVARPRLQADADH